MEEDRLKELKIKYKDNYIDFIKDFRTGFNQEETEIGVLPLLEFEKEYLSFIHNNRYSISLKSRQMHLDSLTSAYAAWLLIQEDFLSIFLITINKNLSTGFIREVSKVLEVAGLGNIGDYLHRNTKDEILLSNNSSIRTLNYASQIEPKLSELKVDRTIMIFSEADYVRDAGKLLNFTEGVIKRYFPENKDMLKIIIYSSPNYYNKESFFQNIWRNKSPHIHNFTSRSFHWSQNPRFNKGLKIIEGKCWSPWYENMCNNLENDQNEIDREFELQFVKNKKKKGKTISLRLEEKIYKSLKKRVLGGSISDYIRELIKNDLKAYL